MSNPVIRQCSNPTCQFRYPTDFNQHSDELALMQRYEFCPKCGAASLVVEQTIPPLSGDYRSHAGHTRKIVALLDNIRSVYNVGSMFRTADGCGLAHMHLCGITATPDHPKISKTALGAEKTIPWTYYNNGVDAARQLRSHSVSLWALEGCTRAQSLFEALHDIPDHPIALVVGNEISGVDPGLISECERLVYIPMLGTKSSLNAATAFGIAAYYLRFITAPQSIHRQI